MDVAKFYHNLCCWLFGLKVSILHSGDTPATYSVAELKSLNATQHVYLSNHVSYLDIIVLGSFLDAVFVAKIDVSSWPLFGVLAKLQRTVFISRDKKGLAEASHKIREALNKGRSLIFFPEGTSTNGYGVAPFRTSLFECFYKDRDGQLLTQNDIVPIAISIDSIDGKRPYLDDSLEDVYAWHGDMTLVPHLWRLAKHRNISINVTIHDPITPSVNDDRKVVAQQVEQKIVESL